MGDNTRSARNMMRNILFIALMMTTVIVAKEITPSDGNDEVSNAEEVAEESAEAVVPEETSELVQAGVKAKTGVKAKAKAKSIFDGRRRSWSDGRRRSSWNWCPSGTSIVPVNKNYATCTAACGNGTDAAHTSCVQACTTTKQNDVLINQNNCRNHCCTSRACCGYTVHESEARCNCDSAVSTAVFSTLAGLVVLFNVFNMQQ